MGQGTLGWDRGSMPTLSCRSGVACGSRSLISGTRRKPSSLTSRSSGRKRGRGLGRWISPPAGIPAFSFYPSHSKNLNNSQSDMVSFRLSVEAQAQVSLNGSVPPDHSAFLGRGVEKEGTLASPMPSSKPPPSLGSLSLRRFCFQ